MWRGERLRGHGHNKHAAHAPRTRTRTTHTKQQRGVPTQICTRTQIFVRARTHTYTHAAKEHKTRRRWHAARGANAPLSTTGSIGTEMPGWNHEYTNSGMRTRLEPHRSARASARWSNTAHTRCRQQRQRVVSIHITHITHITPHTTQTDRPEHGTSARKQRR